MVDIILVTVTVISLVIASVMSLITWRALRQERRRTEARAADLAAAADADQAGDAAIDVPERVVPAQAARRPEAVEIAEDAGPLWTDLVVARTAPAPAHAAPLPNLFAEPEPMRSNGRRLVLAVGLGSAVLLVLFAVVLAFNKRPAVDAAQSPAAARVAAPLELVVLDHARTGDRLAIHGLVRNPAAGSAVRGLTAVIFLFDRDGGFISTVQAPVLERVLGPGGETSFEVPVEAGQRVARYRLTFRVDAAPVPHVDRRASVPPAAPAVTRAAVVAQATLDGTPAGSR
jgi:heme exporter protein D